jgi:site-specific recombinase XerD
MDTRQKQLPLSDNVIVTDSTPKPKLLDQVRALIRTKHYSLRTERAYVFWIKRYIYFHQKRHPAEMGKDEVKRFLSYLATTEKVAASTQNQALAGLLFLYKQVLKVDLPWMDRIVGAKRPKRLPVVLTRRLRDPPAGVWV